jgi:ATP-binding cassette subfamily F protein 3
MNRGRLRCEPGDVEAFLARTEEDRDRVRRANANTMAKRRQLETFIAKNKAGANTASQARSKMKQLERLEIQDEEQADDAAPVIRLPQVERRDGTACRIENLAVGYDERVIAGGLDYDLPRGARIALVGDNGQGKTTLLKTLAGVLPPVSGKAVWTHGADVGVYGQHVYEKLSGDGTVLDHLTRINAGRVSSQKVLDTAGAFLFRGDDVRKPLRVLSGGERARGCLAGLFLAGHNVLMLDEPTNHLDVQTVSALAEALADYAGTVIVASHDRGFIARVSTAVVEARDGRLSVFPGDWAAYLWRLEREADEADGPAAAAKRAKSAAKDAPPPPDAKAANRRRYDLEKQRNNAERKVARLKTELDEAENALNDAGEDPDIITGLAERCADLGRRLAEAEEAWLAAAEALEQHGP